MFRSNLKRPLLTLAAVAGVLAVAGPAGAGTYAGNPGDAPSIQAHAPIAPEPSAGGHPSQGAATVGGGTQTKPKAYRSPTPPLEG